VNEFIDLSDTDVNARDCSIKVAIIADGSDTLRHLIASLEEFIDMRVLAYTHAEAEEGINTQPLDAVVYQARLIETLKDFRNIQELRAKSVNLPVVAMIENRDPDYQREFLRSGVSTFFYDWSDGSFLYEQIRALVHLTNDQKLLQSQGRLLNGA
jgi:DNA-binding NarL/FixJ family response regulator